MKQIQLKDGTIEYVQTLQDIYDLISVKLSYELAEELRQFVVPAEEILYVWEKYNKILKNEDNTTAYGMLFDIAKLM